MTTARITKLQGEMLKRIAHDEYTPVNGRRPSSAREANTYADHVILTNQDRGVVTSLQNKFLVWHDGDNGIGFTEAGFAAYNKLMDAPAEEADPVADVLADIDAQAPAEAEQAEPAGRILNPQVEVTHALDMTPSQEAAVERFILQTLAHCQEGCEYPVRLADLTIGVCEERSTGKALTVSVSLTMVYERATMWTGQPALIGPKGGIDGYRQDRRKGRARLAPIDRVEDLWDEIIVSYGTY